MCQKVKFTKRGAQEALNSIKSHRKQYRKEKRFYRCPVCIGHYHLTSDEQYNEREIIPLEELVFKEDWKKLLVTENTNPSSKINC